MAANFFLKLEDPAINGEFDGFQPHTGAPGVVMEP